MIDNRAYHQSDTENSITCVAYDIVTITDYGGFQSNVPRLVGQSSKIGLEIDLQKTKIIYDTNPPIKIKNQETENENVKRKVYFGHEIILQ